MYHACEGEGGVDERAQVLLATVRGAAVGGVCGCLYLTDQGRRVRRQLEPMFDSVIDELQQSRQTLNKARTAVDEGRRLVDDALHAPEASPWESRDLRQASS